MRCPVCGNYSPDSMKQCQFCSTPFAPVSVPVPQQAPVVSPYFRQPMPQAVPQQPAIPRYPVQQPYPYGASPYTPQPAMPVQQLYPYGAAPSPYSPPQQVQQPVPVQVPVQAPAVPTASVTSQYQYGADDSDFNPDPTEDFSAEAEQAAADEAEAAEQEKKSSTGTTIALVVWFVILGAALAAVHFALPEKVAEYIKSRRSEQDSQSESSYNAPGALDQLYGSWVLCTYYVEDMSDGSTYGGQFDTLTDVPLQFFVFNNGTLDRYYGSSPDQLEHDSLKYSYEGTIYSGQFLLGGSDTPSVSVVDEQMSVCDSFNISDRPCYVEFILLKYSDEPESANAVSLYANAVTSGSIILPEFSASAIVENQPQEQPSVPESSPAGYELIGTWLLTKVENPDSGEPYFDYSVPSRINDTAESDTYNYTYFFFDYSGYCKMNIFAFTDISSTEAAYSDDNSYSCSFNGDLLNIGSIKTDVTVTKGDGIMYFEYVGSNAAGNQIHLRETYRFISSDEYTNDQLRDMRPSF